MKFLTSLFIAFILLINSKTAVAKSYTNEQFRIEVVPSSVSVKDVYREADNVQLILQGMFPNNCYKPVATQVSHVGNKILITDTAMIKEGSICYMAVIPYNKILSLGSLPSGEYELYTNEGKQFKLSGSFKVE